jgi:HAMP domain-containing protein
VQWTLTAMILCVWWGLAFAVRRRAIVPLQTLANLLAALRESDFSIRARAGGPDDTLGEVAAEVNGLAATLREQRLGAIEAMNLLRRMMAEIDVAVFAFDASDRLRLANRAGARCCGSSEESSRAGRRRSSASPRASARMPPPCSLSHCPGERVHGRSAAAPFVRGTPRATPAPRGRRSARCARRRAWPGSV